MDQDARRRIDNARDVLVGKIPDPKAQVEQITTALIYKFMDDMDRDAQGLGGKPTFFTNGYEKYAWTHILDPRIGGQERLNRYAEALSTMSQNPHLPQLFRTIFKDAFLPYRDPTTLNLFLKEIDGFTYNHSENLGDAYEYLLSILGSQGDAGQFRTPRHIIDFMVRVVDPKKNETMLDPASGTAGFVISSYRHIIEQNRDHPLTPDEKERLAGNLQGYDISPDMVRIGLVNMYLHGFPNPHIYEYDTLTSEERWDELFDICMANPPFMTPKGGIRPHKRFQIQANRSELLFVDYIAEHLKPSGRAAVIVPEGIIFQSANAYKALRKMLVETWGLWAVVSLPAGVFQPYSGVKTSILFLDRGFAKKTDEIAFVKVQNDGFDLGAQRRSIDKNDLPEAQAVMRAWLRGERQESPLAQWVSRTTLAENGDCNLSAERYRVGAIRTSAWPLVPLGSVATSKGGNNKVIKGTLATENDGRLFPAYSATGQDVFSPEYDYDGDGVVISAVGARCGKCFLATGRWQAIANTHVLVPNHSMILTKYLFLLVNNEDFWVKGGAAQPFVKIAASLDLQIPLPPLDVQKEIVAEIDGYQRIIDGAKQVIANWRPTFDIDPSWPTVPIEQVAVVQSGYGFPLDFQGKTDEEIPFLKVSDMNLPGNEKEIGHWNHSVSRMVLRELKGEAYPKGTVIFPKIGAAIATNKKRILTRDSTYDNNVMGIIPDTRRLLPDFLYTYLLAFDLSRWASESQPPSMRKTTVEAHEIPIPPLATQQVIVAGIEKEEQVVESCRSLVSTYEAKITATVARLWGEEPQQ
jgi:type I restriction enzyme M protein